MMNGNWFGNGRTGSCGGGSLTNIFGGGLMMLTLLAAIALLIYFIWRGSSSAGRNFHTNQNFSAEKGLSDLSTQELKNEIQKRQKTNDLEAEVASLRAELDSLKKKD